MNLEELNAYDQSQVDLTRRAQLKVRRLQKIISAKSHSNRALKAIIENVSEEVSQASKIAYNDGRFLAGLENTSLDTILKPLIPIYEAKENNGGVRKSILIEIDEIGVIESKGILKTQVFDKSTGLMTEHVIAKESFNIDNQGVMNPVSKIYALPAHQVPVLESIPEPLEKFTGGTERFIGIFNSSHPKFPNYIENFPDGFFIYERRLFCVMKVSLTENKKPSLCPTADNPPNNQKLNKFIKIHATKPYEPEEVELPESYYKLKFPPNLNFEQA